MKCWNADFRPIVSILDLSQGILTQEKSFIVLAYLLTST